MKEDNNIDRLFREKLEGFSQEPPSFLWDGIRDQLAQHKRKKRVIWYRWSSVAALLVLAFVAGWYFNETSTDNQPFIAGSDNSVQKDSPQQHPDNTVTYPKTNDAQSDRGNAYLADAGETGSESTNSGKQQTAVRATVPATAEKRERVEAPERLKPINTVNIAQNVTLAVLPEQSQESELVLTAFEQETVNRNAMMYASASKSETGWRMGVNVSPGYASYRAKHGTAYASNMTHEASDGNANVSGGISVSYKAAKRWSIESGMYFAQNGQQTGSSPQMFGGRAQAEAVASPAEQLYFNTRIKMESSHMAMNSTAGVIAIDNLPAGAEVAANLENTLTDGNSLLTQGELEQVFDLVEIPVYLRYLILESGIDVELVGGVNAGLVVGNNAYLNNQYGEQKIGRTRDISSLNLSGTLGVGLSYALGKHFSLAVEPRFNYYLNSISKNPEVDFRPYRIGVYTGLYYNF